MATVVSRYHCDVCFKYPDGCLDMAQTLSYFERQKALTEADELKTHMQQAGMTDIKVYVREIKVRKENWDD